MQQQLQVGFDTRAERRAGGGAGEKPRLVQRSAHRRVITSLQITGEVFALALPISFRSHTSLPPSNPRVLPLPQHTKLINR